MNIGRFFDELSWKFDEAGGCGGIAGMLFFGGCCLYFIWPLIAAIVAFFVSSLVLCLLIGCLVGLPWGVYNGTKSYMLSTNDNIHNETFKKVITVLTYISVVVIIIAMIYLLIRAIG